MKKRPSSPEKLPFDQLVQALLDPDKPLKARLLYRLSDMSAQDVAQLEQAWLDVPVWRRQGLMEDVETINENDTLLSFEALGRLAIHDPDAHVRLPAVRILWEYEDKDLAQVFMEVLKSDGVAEVRAAAATGLGRYVYLGEIEEISAALRDHVETQLLEANCNDPNALVQRRALEALGYSSREDLPEMLEAAFQRSSLEWKASALLAMGRSMLERWQPTVLEMLGNDAPELRAEAARAAGEMELQAATPRLLRLLKDPEEDVRLASIWSLSQVGGEGVREALEALYERTDDEEEADFIAEALENLEFTEGLDFFELMDVEEVDLEDQEDEFNIFEEIENEFFEDFGDDEEEEDEGA
jgi:hypothetical protein